MTPAANITASPLRLTLVVPCYNEQSSLSDCIEAVLAIADDTLSLQIVIVDDASTDDSLSIARDIAQRRSDDLRCIEVLTHGVNRGKGAAIRTGLAAASGDVVAVQDADLEYDPADLRRLVGPIRDGHADVVFGSRFVGDRPHRVLHYWHMLGNRVLTTLSNMMTDMNLTDMETCYKVFRREVIESITIAEDRFGFEPEIVAKIADRRLRVYEMGIAYRGRTYAEGKKIGWRDGLRAVYCIVHYNSHRTSVVIQAALYTVVGAVAAGVNLAVFAGLIFSGASVGLAAAVAFGVAAGVNYWLCVRAVFRDRSRWGLAGQLLCYAAVVLVAGTIDVGLAVRLVAAGWNVLVAKMVASAAAFATNFLGRRWLVFRGDRRGDWSASR